MAVINMDYLKPGMVLTSDVTCRNGRLLLPGGTELTEKHLHVFRTWGITEADIQGVSEEEVEAAATDEIDPLRLQEATAEMELLFRHTNLEHPAMKELFRLCALRKATDAAA